KLTWVDSISHCKSLTGNADLVSIESSEENEFLLGMIKDFKQHTCTDFYTSGKRSGGTWSWRSTRQPFRYTAWGPGEPNDHGSSEDVLAIFQSDQHGYIWNDISPAAKLCCICEFN
ncbi:hypothetical protein LSAT2_012997, partial [Lamellibrachia satsuma]